jgi:hypothetical protein
MIVYNRRKRTEFYAVMEKLRSDEYAKALEADAKGEATDDQTLLINQERARMEQMRIDKEKKEKGVWRRMKEQVVGTETYEEQKGGTLGVGRKRGGHDAPKSSVGEAVGDLLASRDEKLGFGGEKAAGVVGTPAGARPVGGPLDQLAQQTAESVSSNTKSWTSWITGR